MHTLKTFTDQVHKMRLAQERVDHLAESMTEFDSIRDAMLIAEKLEEQVDQSIQEIIKHVSDTNVGDIGQRAEKQIDNSYFATEKLLNKKTWHITGTRTSGTILAQRGNSRTARSIPLDEGEIRLRIGHVEGRIVVDFGKPITSVGFTKEQALEIGQALIQKALDIR